MPTPQSSVVARTVTPARSSSSVTSSATETSTVETSPALSAALRGADTVQRKTVPLSSQFSGAKSSSRITVAATPAIGASIDRDTPPSVWRITNLSRPGYVYAYLQVPKGTTKVIVYRHPAIKPHGTPALNVSRPSYVTRGSDGSAVVEIDADLLDRPGDQFFEIRLRPNDAEPPYVGPVWWSELDGVRVRQ